MRAIACETCTFWVAGECHRHAPPHADRSYVNPNQPENGRIAEYAAEWPRTAKADWCGDHAYNRET